MKYVKTFESFVTDFDSFDSEKLDEGFFSDLKERVVGWFKKMKDASKQKIADRIAKNIEKQKNSQTVKEQISKIQKAFNDLSDEDKKKFQSLFGSEKAIDETGKKLEKAGAEEILESIQESIESGKPSDVKVFSGRVMKYLGLSTALVSIIVMIIGLLTSSDGYVNLLGIENMPAGVFCAIGCAVVMVSGIISFTGIAMTKDFD